MADVDLRVEVTSAGVPAAIANLESLKSKGLQTASAMTQLATATRTAMGNITASTSGATGRITGFRDAITSTKTSAESLTRQLTLLEQGYSKISRLSPGASARERLTTFGGAGGLQAGLANAGTVQSLRNTFNADPVRDMMEVERQEQELLVARSGKLGAMAAVERATWESSLQGMTATERATARVARAETELATASKAVNQSFIQQRGTGGRFLPFTAEQIQGQTRALNEQAGAVRGLTSAQGELARAQEAHANNSNAFQSSYSYFILAGLATQASQKIREVGAAATTATAEIERSFADVNRTFDGTSAQLQSLRDKLTDLSTSTPNSFVDLAQIAALGNQLGVAASDIQSFTTVIAEYTAISGQTAEDSATAFGKISNLTGLAASQYSNLASSITYVARTSVATEATIQRTATEITALASGAGFSADAIVGLAGALSSLAIPPERARGALSLYFGALNSAVAEGGPKMEAFATLTGKTAEELGRLVRENKGQEIFTAFISGLSQLDTVAKTSALDTLGLSTIRVDQTMRALSQNVPLVTQSFAGANKAFTENSELSRQYAIIQEQLSSKITEFQNAMQNAAAAVGSSFGPALSDLLASATEITVQFSKFAQTPYGQTMLKIATAVAVVVAVIASLVGTLALANASFIVFRFALSGLGWTSASAGFAGLIASLFSTDLATRKAALSMASLKGAMAETNIGARALAIGLNLLKFTVVLAALAVVVQVFSELDQAIRHTEIAIDGLGASSDELRTAMKADNAALFADQVRNAGDASTGAEGGVRDLNDSILSMIDAQQAATGAVDSTNKAVDSQKVVLGEATQAWLQNAVLQSQAMKDILAESNSLWADLTEPKAVTGDKTKAQILEDAIGAGLDIDKITKTAYTKGTDAALAVYDGWRKTLEKKSLAGDEDAGILLMNLSNIGINLRDNFIGPLADGIGGAKVQALIASSLMENVTQAAENGAVSIDSMGNSVAVLSAGFHGAHDSLEEFQGAVQSGLSSFVQFSTILTAVNAAADKAKNSKLVNASAFSDELGKANAAATDFFTGIQQLAGAGRTSFATQLAQLGPDAQGILSSALKLSPEGQANLEAQARFAAFLASDAFKSALATQMAETNDAYALIFKSTGDLGQVQSYIAAQVNGTADIWEQQWAVNHPDAPINVRFVDPSDADIFAWTNGISGRLKVTAEVTPVYVGSSLSQGTRTYSDTKTGASITLPASLDQSALNASLAYWVDNENATPEQIAAALNTDGFNQDIANWVKAHGPVRVSAILAPTSGLLPSPITHSKGGPIERFASGGGWGEFHGPGTGTSDSILARVSAGEYINTSGARSFWGSDFFDSLNRKMLPTSFLHMLSAAAASGSQGPTHVAHVSVQQNNPLTRDPLKQLREDSERLLAGIWGDQ